MPTAIRLPTFGEYIWVNMSWNEFEKYASDSLKWAFSNTNMNRHTAIVWDNLSKTDKLAFLQDVANQYPDQSKELETIHAFTWENIPLSAVVGEQRVKLIKELYEIDGDVQRTWGKLSQEARQAYIGKYALAIAPLVYSQSLKPPSTGRPVPSPASAKPNSNTVPDDSYQLTSREPSVIADRVLLGGRSQFVRYYNQLASQSQNIDFVIVNLAGDFNRMIDTGLDERCFDPEFIKNNSTTILRYRIADSDPGNKTRSKAFSPWSMDMFDNVFAFMKTAYEQGKTVIVHCDAGANRSPAFVVYFLMKQFNCSFYEAKQHVHTYRSVTQHSQLINY